MVAMTTDVPILSFLGTRVDFVMYDVRCMFYDVDYTKGLDNEVQGIILGQYPGQIC